MKSFITLRTGLYVPIFRVNMTSMMLSKQQKQNLLIHWWPNPYRTFFGCLGVAWIKIELVKFNTRQHLWFKKKDKYGWRVTTGQLSPLDKIYCQQRKKPAFLVCSNFGLWYIQLNLCKITTLKKKFVFQHQLLLNAGQKIEAFCNIFPLH